MLSLLLVEDDTALGEELHLFLLDFFEKVTVFTNANDALVWLKNNTADVIMSDICMPDMNGLDFLKRIRKERPHQLLIVISGHPQTDYLLQSIALGIYRFIVKPFDSQQLIEEMHTLTRHLRHQKPQLATSTLWIGEIVQYDLETKRLCVNQKPVHLTKKEGVLLHLLALNRHHCLSEETMAQNIWEEPVPPSTVRALIRRLREKLALPRAIVNYRGFGYQLKTYEADSPRAD
ncbi:response regulator transcription factor [Sulfurospirillum sp. T05]|uniref:Response regulator transcription factor n=1 Tax=Sulfurospirillum tamanense TaxID=2813362 RepID=A0ABS2WU97_9BACT|nr:response regulator transcription factor [Sulfurospirillum tamanensis]MBN2965234.1 response regulator transcription factor [Sulfurospirillum tamanensis]